MSTQNRKRINPVLIKIAESDSSGNNCDGVLSVQTRSFCILQNILILASNYGELHCIQSEGSRFDPSSFDDSSSALKNRPKSFKVEDLDLLEKWKGRSYRRRPYSSIISLSTFFHHLVILVDQSDSLYILEEAHGSLKRSSEKDITPLSELLPHSIGTASLLSFDTFEVAPFGFVGCLDDKGTLHVMFIENVQSGASDELGNSPILQIQAEECTPVCEGDCDTVCLRFSPSNTTYVSCVAECLLVTGVKGEVRMWTCERKKDSDVDVIRINLQRVFSVSSSSVVTCLCWVYPTINGVDLCGSTSNGTLYFWGSSGECNGTTDWNLVLAYEHSNAPINHIAVCSHGEASYLQSEQSVHESEDAARRRGLILTGDLFGCIRLYRPDLLAKEGVDSVGSVGTLNQTPSSVGDGFSSRSPSLPPLFELVAEIKLNSACRGFFVSKEVNDADGDCFITIASEFGEIKQFDEQRLPIRQPSLPSAAADIGEDFESDLIDAHKSIARLSEYVMQESSMGEEASTVEKCPVLEPEPPLDGESSSCPAPIGLPFICLLNQSMMAHYKTVDQTALI